MKYIIGIFLTLSLLGCTARRINLSDFKNPRFKNVSYLLVNKSADYEQPIGIYAEKIDDIELDLLEDPCVYIVDVGSHVIKFRVEDFENDVTTIESLCSRFEVNRYYQIFPLQNDSDQADFTLQEISKRKPRKIFWREFREMIAYLLRGEC